MPRAVTPVIGEFPDALSWHRKIPLITNPWLVLQGIVIPFFSGVLLGCILSLLSGEDMFVFFLLIGTALSVLFLVIMLVLQLMTGGGLETEFFIGSRGVAHRAGRTTQAIDRMTTAGLVLGGSVSGAGAGLIAISQEFNVLPWDDVRYVSVFRSVRSVVFRTQYLIGPVVLYCTEENFPLVLAMVRRYAPSRATQNL
jgi:hypothetical protein